jgi:hypothetical protein
MLSRVELVSAISLYVTESISHKQIAALTIFLVVMTNFILLIGAGLFTKAVNAYQEHACVSSSLSFVNIIDSCNIF